MKKSLMFLLVILTMAACKKEIITNNAQLKKGSIAENNYLHIIKVCHLNSEIISIDIHAWPAHRAHGDVRLDDQDGDGFVPDNPCGYGLQGDCNDNNAAIHPGDAEICGNGIDENCNGMSDDVCLLSVGQDYQGGIIAYILQPGDPGYSGTIAHGLIAAPSDQSGQNWEWGCNGIAITGADGTALGTGNQNTIDIMAGCGTADIAARICGDLVLNGFSDWYLPSKDELYKLYLHQGAIGGFAIDIYWSSSEFDDYNAWVQDFSDGDQFFHGKSDNGMFSFHPVRAVRSF